MQRLRRVTSLCSTVLLGCLLLPTSTDAQQTSGVIYACVNMHLGLTRIVGAAEPCRAQETRVQWNVAGPAGPPGQPGAAGQQGIPGPPGPVGIPVPAEVTVNCGIPQTPPTLSQVLQETSGRPLTITVTGECHENLVITRDDVTIQGGPPWAGIIGDANSSQDTILIDGAKRVTLAGLTVSGGANGVRGRRGAVFTVHQATVQTTGGIGILVEQNSQAVIDGAVVARNPGDGIRVIAGSSVVITNSMIGPDNMYGIEVLWNSSARIGLSETWAPDRNTIKENRYSGIVANHGSSAGLYGNTIQGNCTASPDYEGVGAYYSSTIGLYGGNTITQNQCNGVFLRAATLRKNALFSNAPADAISSNGGTGLYAQENSDVDLRYPVTITNNLGSATGNTFGILVEWGSRLRMDGTTVTGNVGGGIFITYASSARIRTGNTVSENQGYALDCTMNGGPSYTLRATGGNTLDRISPTCTPF